MSEARESRRTFLTRVAAGAAGTLAMQRAPQGQTVTSIPDVQAGERTTSFALLNVSVIDGTGSPAQAPMTVVIAGNRIEALGPASMVTLPRGVTVSDATGKFLIPGLWDMHSHAWRGGVSPLFIPNGVTGTRTMGGDHETVVNLVNQRREIAEGTRLGPRLIVGSRTLEAERVADPERARAVVRTYVELGVDFIKIHNAISRESYFAAIAEAKTLNIPFVGHVPTLGPDPVRLEECAAAGQRSIEHMAGVIRYLAETTSADTGAQGRPGRGVSMASVSASQSRALFDVFLKNKVWLCPTLTIIFGLGGQPTLRQDPRLRYIDDATKTRWAAVFSNSDLANVRQRYENILGVIAAMHRAGVGLMAGTDTSGSQATPYVLPGFGLHDELRHLVAAGLRPIDALRCATSKAAEFLGLLGSLGTVERGKLAELVLLDANPLDDISNTQKINMVITGGRVYRRPALDSMLNAIEINARTALE